MVGAGRFELPIFCTQNKRDTRLRYAPKQILNCQVTDCKYLIDLSLANTGAKAPFTVWSPTVESNHLAHWRLFYRQEILPWIWLQGIADKI
jgi:hypothetical protein